MRAPKKRTAASYAFASEADCFISAPSTSVFRKYAEPNSMRLGFSNNMINQCYQKAPPITPVRMANRDPLYMDYALSRIPIAHDGEADRFCSMPSNKVSMPAIYKRVAMLRFAPAADKLLVARKSLRRHDEWNIFVCPSVEAQRIRFQEDALTT